MKSVVQHIRVFEHQSIRLDQVFDNDVIFDQEKLDALVDFFTYDPSYFSLIRNGVQFKEFVGALQVGNLLISVLPKTDKTNIRDESEKTRWNNILIDMIKAVHGFKVKAPSESGLNTSTNSILNLYFELFIKEVEYLLRSGLAKKYRKIEGNLYTLKGSLMLNKHVSKNLVHKERFYTGHTVYDKEHLLHIILYQALLVIKQLNSNKALNVKLNRLLLDFPEMPTIKINEQVFTKIKLDRKTKAYQRALDIARLILLRFHPNLIRGNQNVLALMFDMNSLWEEFVLASLKQNKNMKVRGQNTRRFWKPTGGKTRGLRPDIVIRVGELNYILDAKWKIVSNKPSIEDIRQMYAYHHYFKAEKVALLYPGSKNYVTGNFTDINNPKNLSTIECGLLFTEMDSSVKAWQGHICQEIEEWADGHKLVPKKNKKLSSL